MSRYSNISTKAVLFFSCFLFINTVLADQFDVFFEQPAFNAETQASSSTPKKELVPQNRYSEPVEIGLNPLDRGHKPSIITLPKGADIFDAALKIHANEGQSEVEVSIAKTQKKSEEQAYNTQVIWETDAGYIHSKISDQALPDKIYNNDVVVKTRVNLRKVLWDSALDSSIQSAQHNVQTAIFKQFDEQQHLIESVALTYLDYLAAKEMASIAQQRSRLFTQIRKQIDTKMSLGYAADIDIAEVENQLQTANISLLTAQINLQQTKINLHQLTDNDRYHITGNHSPFNAKKNISLKPISNLIKMALTNNTEMQSLQSEQLSLQKNLQSKRLGTSPKFNLVSSLSQAWKEGDQDQNSFDLSVGVNMRMPLYTGGRIDNQIKQAKLELLHTERRSNRKRREIMTQLNILSSEFSGSLSSYKSLLQLRKQLTKNVKLIKAAVPFGVRESGHIYSALDDQFQLENSLIRQYYDLLKTKVKVLKITGELDSSNLDQLRRLL